MIDSLDDFPKKSPEKKSSRELAKEHLRKLEEQITQEGGSDETLETWSSLYEKIDQGKENEVLVFLENLKFRKKENIESWRKAILGISSVEIPLLSEEELTDFMKKEFELKLDQQEAGDLSFENKLEIIEDQIRILYEQHAFLKKEIEEVEKKVKQEKAIPKEKKRLKEDKKLLRSIPEDLYVYRKIRTLLYQREYLQEDKSQ